MYVNDNVGVRPSFSLIWVKDTLILQKSQVLLKENQNELYIVKISLSHIHSTNIKVFSCFWVERKLLRLIITWIQSRSNWLCCCGHPAISSLFWFVIFIYSHYQLCNCHGEANKINKINVRIIERTQQQTSSGSKNHLVQKLFKYKGKLLFSNWKVLMMIPFNRLIRQQTSSGGIVISKGS